MGACALFCLFVFCVCGNEFVKVCVLVSVFCLFSFKCLCVCACVSLYVIACVCLLSRLFV